MGFIIVNSLVIYGKFRECCGFFTISNEPKCMKFLNRMEIIFGWEVYIIDSHSFQCSLAKSLPMLKLHSLLCGFLRWYRVNDGLDNFQLCVAWFVLIVTIWQNYICASRRRSILIPVLIRFKRSHEQLGRFTPFTSAVGSSTNSGLCTDEFLSSFLPRSFEITHVEMLSEQ